jgi:hypothetical protein
MVLRERQVVRRQARFGEVERSAPPRNQVQRDGGFQVAYYRETIEGPNTITVDGVRYPMSDAVVRHFSRGLMDIELLSSSSVRIRVFNSQLANREVYMRELQAALADIALDSPCVVFLDPDTGLEPQKTTPGLEHVLNSELKTVWNAMRGDDVLVFYQHKTDRRKGESWISAKRGQFESVLGLSKDDAKLAQGDAATDVVFFFAQKPPTGLSQKDRPT